MRIAIFSVFAGTGINAIKNQMRDLGHEVVLLVTTRGRPEVMNETKLKLFEERMQQLDHDIPVLVINRLKGLSAILQGVNPDLMFVMNFPFRISKGILAVPRLGSLNLHPSWLPKYRGPNPFGWQILNGEPYLGLTFHRMDEQYDTGPIMLQYQSPIGPSDDYHALIARIPELVMSRLPDVLKLAEEGYPGVMQDDAEATYTHFFSEEERTIDWTKSAEYINRLIRAAAGDGALAYFGGESYKIWESVMLGSANGHAGDYRLGEPVRSEDGSLIVLTGDGLLRLTRYTVVESQPKLEGVH
jgi:methionyl-tRNA formyltransferase